MISVGANEETVGPTGLQIRLGEGTEAAETYQPVTAAQSKPMGDADIATLLERLPALETGPGDAVDFALRPASLPAPRTGETIQEPFPPPVAPETPETTATGPLAVLRYAPEGAVDLAPYLSVTFDQPMVALTSLQDLAAQAVPVLLSPEPPGKWRWVGTKTLMFEPTGRFPMATEYKAEIPAGTKSAIDGVLPGALTWTFTTPPPQMETGYPSDGPQRLDPVIFISFNQRIDPEAVLETIKVTAGGSAVNVRLATEAELAADKTVSRLANNTGEGRWLAIVAGKPLPPDTAIKIVVGPGTPSAEGPRKTEKAESFGFQTYGPLRVREHQCGWGNECAPMTPWRISFTNPLDGAGFDPTMLTVTPEVPGLDLQIWGDTITLQGRTAGRTTYKVWLSADIPDVFGQTLGADQELTFKVGSAPEALWAPSGDLAVLDPVAEPGFSVFSINYDRLKVQAYAVTPQDWPAYRRYLREYDRTNTPPNPPGRLVIDTTLATSGVRDQLTETVIDLGAGLEDGLGHLVLIVKPETGLSLSLFGRRQRPPVIQTWIQSTHIGLDAFVDHSDMLAWANSLADGAPLAGVEMSLIDTGEANQDDRVPLPDPVVIGKPAATETQGTTTFALPGDQTANLLLAQLGPDTAFLPASPYRWGGDGWQRRGVGSELRWYVFDDRAMYRPSEEVHVKGWIRSIGGGQTGDVGLPQGVGQTVNYRVIDSRGNEIQTGAATMSALGGFDLAFTLPDTVNLGYTSIEFNSPGYYTHQFQVQEFRRPEFEVKTSVSDGPHFVGESAVAEVTASYYAGGGLANADVNWLVTSRPGHFRPPNWDDFIFGTWIPWWRSYWGEPSVETGENYSGQTDAAGIHRLRIDFESVDPPEPTSVTAEATVMDVNRQAWTSTTNLLVHPASLYVGLRTDRLFVEREEPLRVDAIVTDLDGNAVAGREIRMEAARLKWELKNGQWQEAPVTPQPCTVLSGEEPVRCTFETPEGGTYRITAIVTDDQARPNRTQLTRWVSGGQRPPSRELDQEEVTLIPDRDAYQPGDIAEILVQAPFYPAEGLMTLRRSGIVTSERFTMDGPSYTLKVPIETAHIPNLYLQVDLVGAAARVSETGETQPDLPKRPAFAVGQLNLPVPPLARTLALEVLPQADKLEPGGTTQVDVTVVDATGEPVAGAELAVVVVDEAVLALTGYQQADPLALFYADRPADVGDYHLRNNVLLASPDQFPADELQAQAMATKEMSRGIAMAPMAAPAAEQPMMEMAAMDNAAGADDGAGAPIAVRTDFNALALFAPAAPTDKTGHATVEVILPDNLTRYRVMVVAVDAGGKQFGKAESNITARLPLMVRPSPPRFLNFGDRFELPIVVQNQTDSPLTVDVAVRATNVLLTAGAGRQVTVPANDRLEVRFPATTDRAGTARFQIAASAGRWADAAQFDFPVWTPATTEAFAVYGEIDEGAIVQPVIAPSNVYTQFGGLEITTSSTALQALTDSVLYLVNYRFECSEQLASRILAVAALRDVLTAFKAEGLPPASEIEDAVARDIERLQGMQNGDGGFPIWRRGEESWPYHSIHVAHALQRARLKGFEVPPEMLARAQDYLVNIERHIPSRYGIDARRALIAYALYVRNLMGDADPSRARALITEAGLEKLSPEAIGWLLPVLSDDKASADQVAAIHRHLQNRVTETASTAHFVASYSDDDYLLLNSNRRADGILLDALIGDRPESDLIPKIVRGLLANRTRGRWGNTQENAFILLALDRYFNTYEATTPDFVARVWLGEGYAGDAEFRGRTTEYRQIDIPMAFLAATDGPQDLVLQKDGAGRLYYRLGMRYAPTDLNLPPYEAGFTVERTYEAVDDPEDVRKDAAGVWHVKAGARVRVRLTIVAPARRYHVALIDPLPAGFETLNPGLAVTGSLPDDPQSNEGGFGWWWWRTWYEHQNLRDERAEAFTSLLWEGVYTYSYVARATTPGEFVAPPPKAEEMYAPETFGRGASDRVVVE